MLNVIMGYMNYYNAGMSSPYGISVLQSFGTVASPRKYSSIYCGSGSSSGYTCLQTTNLSQSSSSTYVSSADAAGATPLAFALSNVMGNTNTTAKSTIDTYRANDTFSACRNNYVILITDGADTLACPNVPAGSNACTASDGSTGECGSGFEDYVHDYPRRRATVASTYNLAQDNIKTFVIGFGGMSPNLLNTLNWAAYYGDPKDWDSTVVPTPPSLASLNITPAGISSPCATSTTPDPGDLGNTLPTASGGSPIGARAFSASNPSDLSAALSSAISSIQSGNYSFSLASVSTARITSENNIYEASFKPSTNPPRALWQGFIKKYNILSTGALDSSGILDGGANLLAQSPGSWAIKTLIGNSTVDFSSVGSSYFQPNCTAAPCSTMPTCTTAGDTTCRDQIIVPYFQGTLPNPVTGTGEIDGWLLGDIWHSTPVVITSPSAYFSDAIDQSIPKAFDTFRSNHQRPSGGGRVVVTGANDGQFHVFETQGMTQKYSFIPPNLLPKLQLIAHKVLRPANSTHQYYVDGPVSAADVWLGPSGTQTSKVASDWHTLLVFGEGRGVEHDSTGQTPSYLWSSSAGCDSGFAPTSSTWTSTTFSTYKYYCGYYAFDFTAMSSSNYSPTYAWKINATYNSANDPKYFAEPWSKMAMGRVKIGGQEKWVGIVGGGGYSYTCATPAAPSPTSPLPSTAGQGIFVIDLSNGNVIWSFTSANNAALASVVAPPSIVDTDNDGFVDTAYVGDLAGNMWRLTFCTAAQGSSCGTANWTGNMLYQHDSLNRPIYGGVSVTMDSSNNLWVYWGSGDEQCPAPSLLQSPLVPYSTSDRLYAIIDRNRTSSYSSTNLKQITGSTTYNYSTDIVSNKNGWYFNLGSNESMVSTPLVFGGITFFTTFTPATTSCAGAGSGTLYGFNYTTGGGALTSGSTTLSLGDGIPSSPVVSLNPNANDQANMYVTISGGGGGGNNSALNEKTYLVPFNPPMRSNRSNMIYWKDRRVQ